MGKKNEEKKNKNNKKKGRLTTILLVILLIAGIGLLTYPSIADYWNSLYASRAVASYIEEAADMSEEEMEAMIEEAREYNRSIVKGQSVHELSPAEQKRYDSTLDLSETGIMGYIDIPCIDCTLPIYHGTSDAVLQEAAGHLEWSSFPVGGESTHAVISGHRGLPSAKLFTRLDELVEGDYFMVYVGSETCTYLVDQIRIVLPEETDDLLIEKGKDYCTLITCTPYGVNTHRLLVRGVRTDNIFGEDYIGADAVQVDRLIVAAVLAVFILLVLLIWLLVTTRKRK